MPTRRQTIIGLGSAAAGGAVLSAGAFSSSVSADADMRVVVVSDLRLLAAREDAAYVDAEAEGDPVREVVIEELNRNAFSEFGNIARILNEGDTAFEAFEFEFDADEEGVAEVLSIVSESGVTEDGGTFTLTPDGGLEPGESVDFGVSVDLLPEDDTGLSDVPGTTDDIDLHIYPLREN